MALNDQQEIAVRKGLVRCHIWLRHTEVRPVGAERPRDGSRAAQPDQGVRGVHGRGRPRPRRPDRVVLRAARPVGVRQDHDAADGRRVSRRRRPARSGWRARTSPTPSPTGGRSTPCSRTTRCSRTSTSSRTSPSARAAARRAGVDDEVHADARAGRAGQPGPQEAGPALRWPAAARRAGPGPDQQARGAAARRAAGRPRPQAAPADADRAQAHPDRGRDRRSSTSPTTRRRP